MRPTWLPWRRWFRWSGAALLAGVVFSGGPATAQQASATDEAGGIQTAFETVGEEDFAESFPDGKRSVVAQEVDATATVLTTAHRAALDHGHQRRDYREALVHQAAARRALADGRYAVAMYLTLHAREIGHAVIWANSTHHAAGGGPTVDLAQLQQAGGVTAADVAAYVGPADAEVPALELLFVE